MRLNDFARVYVNGKYGEITGSVPGNGRSDDDRWYYVRFEDGSEDRFQASELTVV